MPFPLFKTKKKTLHADLIFLCLRNSVRVRCKIIDNHYQITAMKAIFWSLTCNQWQLPNRDFSRSIFKSCQNFNYNPRQVYFLDHNTRVNTMWRPNVLCVFLNS